MLAPVTNFVALPWLDHVNATKFVHLEPRTH